MHALARIDGFEFAASGLRQAGRLRVSALARLHDRLASRDGELDYEVAGVRDGQGRAGLRIRAGGVLQIVCPRCMQEMRHPVSIDETVLLAESQGALDSQSLEADGPEWILASRNMDVVELLEDELILDLPAVLNHEGCKGSGVEAASARTSPFESLKGLLSKDGKPGN